MSGGRARLRVVQALPEGYVGQRPAGDRCACSRCCPRLLEQGADRLRVRRHIGYELDRAGRRREDRAGVRCSSPRRRRGATARDRSGRRRSSYAGGLHCRPTRRDRNGAGSHTGARSARCLAHRRYWHARRLAFRPVEPGPGAERCSRSGGPISLSTPAPTRTSTITARLRLRGSAGRSPHPSPGSMSGPAAPARGAARGRITHEQPHPSCESRWTLDWRQGLVSGQVPSGSTRSLSQKLGTRLAADRRGCLAAAPGPGRAFPDPPSDPPGCLPPSDRTVRAVPQHTWLSDIVHQVVYAGVGLTVLST